MSAACAFWTDCHKSVRKICLLHNFQVSYGPIVSCYLIELNEKICLVFGYVIPRQLPCESTTCSPSGKLRLLRLPVCSPNIFDGNPSRIDAKGSTSRVQGPSPLSYECSNLHPQASSYILTSSILLLTRQSSEHVSIAPMDEVRNISEQWRFHSN